MPIEPDYTQLSGGEVISHLDKADYDMASLTQDGGDRAPNWPHPPSFPHYPRVAMNESLTGFRQNHSWDQLNMPCLLRPAVLMATF